MDPTHTIRNSRSTQARAAAMARDGRLERAHAETTEIELPKQSPAPMRSLRIDEPVAKWCTRNGVTLSTNGAVITATHTASGLDSSSTLPQSSDNQAEDLQREAIADLCRLVNASQRVVCTDATTITDNR